MVSLVSGTAAAGASADAMTKATEQRSLNIAGALIAFGIVTLLAYVTWNLSTREVPEKNIQLYTSVVQIVSNGVMLVLGFFFGNSLQSRKQSDTNSQLAEAVNTALATDPPKGKESP